MPCERGVLCGGCRADLPLVGPACDRCAIGLPNGQDRLCGPCLTSPPPWDRAFAPFRYHWPVDQLLQRFKYRRQFVFGRLLSEQYASLLMGEARQRPEILIPVPTTRWRLMQRGHHHAASIAGDVGKALRIPVRYGLRRTRHAAPQAGLDAPQRRRNQRNSMCWRGQRPPPHVAIIDDVLTTGATAAECTRAVREAGASTVEIWVLARVTTSP